MTANVSAAIAEASEQTSPQAWSRDSRTSSGSTIGPPTGRRTACSGTPRRGRRGANDLPAAGAPALFTGSAEEPGGVPLPSRGERVVDPDSGEKATHPDRRSERFEAPAPVAVAESAEEIHKRLYEAVAELSRGAAEILILRYVHDYSDAAIAKLLGTSRGTIAVSLYRSRARLRTLMRASSPGGRS